MVLIFVLTLMKMNNDLDGEGKVQNKLIESVVSVRLFAFNENSWYLSQRCEYYIRIIIRNEVSIVYHLNAFI